MRLSIAVLALFLVAAPAFAQDSAVRETLRRFDEAKPTDETLAFYSLDWVCSLEQAKQRAKAEHRWILLILNTNITAHCDFYSGHT